MKLLRQLHYAADKIDIPELTQEMIESDIDKLNEIEQQVGLYVDRKIVHLDRREFWWWFRSMGSHPWLL